MRLFGEQGAACSPCCFRAAGRGAVGRRVRRARRRLDDEIASIAEMDRTLNRTKQQLLALVMPIVRQAVRPSETSPATSAA